MQLTTVGKEVFRGARKALELAEAGAGDLERLRRLKQVEALSTLERGAGGGEPQPGQLPPLEGKAQGAGTHRPETQKQAAPTPAGQGALEPRGGRLAEGEPHLGALAHLAFLAEGGLYLERAHGGAHPGLPGGAGTRRAGGWLPGPGEEGEVPAEGAKALRAAEAPGL